MYANLSQMIKIHTVFDIATVETRDVSLEIKYCQFSKHV